MKTLRGFNRKVSKTTPGWIPEATPKTEKLALKFYPLFFSTRFQALHNSRPTNTCIIHVSKWLDDLSFWELQNAASGCMLSLSEVEFISYFVRHNQEDHAHVSCCTSNPEGNGRGIRWCQLVCPTTTIPQGCSPNSARKSRQVL